MVEQHASSDNDAGADWSLIDSLGQAHSGGPTDRAVPEVKLLEVREGVRIIRIAFRVGDVMASHKAPGPIVILGQTGEVDVHIGEEGDPGAGDVTLRPGSALHIDTGKVHSLFAGEPATVTLLLLSGT